MVYFILIIREKKITNCPGISYSLAYFQRCYIQYFEGFCALEPSSLPPALLYPIADYNSLYKAASHLQLSVLRIYWYKQHRS